MVDISTFPSAIWHAQEAARGSGRILLEYYGKLETIRDKNTQGDLVTEADLASEKYLLAFFNRQFPKDGVLAEESGAKTTESAWQWVIDPLDGTTNFAHQNPLFAVSIGLLYHDRPVLGVVFNPFYDEMFLAAEGIPTSLNGQLVKVSKTSSLEKSLLATGFPYDRKGKKDNNYQEFCHLTDATHGVRRGGSAALDLAYVASGRLDGYWEQGVKPWDIAAGTVLVRQAGGIVTAYDENAPLNMKEERILATNGFIHSPLSHELLSCKR